MEDKRIPFSLKESKVPILIFCLWLPNMYTHTHTHTHTPPPPPPPPPTTTTT
jgi:hypothetical protein